MPRAKQLRHKRRRVPFDEAYSFGPLRMGRLGRLTVLENRSSTSEHAKFVQRSAEYYEVIIQDMNECITQIREICAERHPIQLLQGGYFEILREFSGKKAEHQHGHESVLALRMVDYVQSVIAATPPKSDGYTDLDEGSWSILVSSVSKLFELLLPFFICQTSHRKQTGRAHDNRLEALFTQLEMIWVLVRGDRHGAHHIPHMADLLAPHEAAINDVYGVRVADITAGLGRIRENLGRGIHDAISALHRMGFELEGMAGLNQGSAADQLTLQTGLPHGSEPAAPGLRSTSEHLSELVQHLLGWDLFDVGKATGWPEALIRDLSWEPGEEPDFFAPGEWPGSPLRVWPIFKRPFLAFNGHSYCFEPASLFDHYYRVLQRAVCRAKPKYIEVWNRAQNSVSEGLPLRFLADILRSPEVFQNAYYKTREWNEVDGIILCGDVLFVVEVKAGAFIRDPPATDFESYFRAISDSLTKPARQAHRFLSALKRIGKVHLLDRTHSRCLRELSADEVRVCVPLCVTLDNVSHLAARSFAMSAVDPDIERYPSWIVSIDDLRVFKDVFRSPGIFCHFAEQRMKAAKSDVIPVFDEMDHLGLYISKNQYVDAFEQFEGRIGFHGFAAPIDEYYYDVEFGDAPPHPPAQRMPLEFRHLISALDQNVSGDNIRATSVLLDFGDEGRESIAGKIRDLKQESKKKGRGIVLAIASEYVPITISCGGPGYAIDRSLINDESRAELLRQQADERLVVVLQCDASDSLFAAEAWFVSRDDMSPEDRSRLAEISDRQAQRRLSRVRLSRVGRNESCPCGSGKKFKRCCIGRR